MKYYSLSYSSDEEDNLPEGLDPILVDEYEMNGFDLRRLWRGENIEKLPKNIDLCYESGSYLLDYVPSMISWFIVTNRVIEMLKDLNSVNIQVFPINIYNFKNRDEYKEVYVLNILETVAAFDWEESKYDLWDDEPTDIKYIRNLVLKDRGQLENIDFFRLEELPYEIILSERVKKEVEKRGLKGFGWTELKVNK